MTFEKLDLRGLQILFLGSFLSYGILVLDWDMRPEFIAVMIISAVLTQSLFCLAFNLPIHAVKSAVISSLGMLIILRSNYWYIFAFAGFFAIGSKYIFRWKHKHFINPANFGIIFGVLFTGVARISLEQWGSGPVLFFIVISLGLMSLTHLKKIDLALFFTLFYFGMDFSWNILYKGYPLDYFLNNFCNGSTVLFAFFIIMDPSSTPNSAKARILWVFSVSVLAFCLANFACVKAAPFYSLFILGALVPFLDGIFKDSRFSWDSMKRREFYTNAHS